MATHSDIHVVPGVFNLLNAALHAQIDRFVKFRTYRNTLNALYALSERELTDMGLNGLSLRDAAYETAYGNDR